MFVISVCAFGQGLTKELLANFDDTQKKIVSLAEAVPAEKYSWRPSAGVRSISEVYMHIVGANYLITSALGAKPPANLDRNMEKTVTQKEKVVEMLKQSSEHARKALAEADPAKSVKLFGREMTGGAVQLIVVTHLHEHLGQSIAYARSNNVTPPWSQSQ